MCGQKQLGEKDHIYDRKTLETKIGRLQPSRCSITRTQALNLSGLKGGLSSLPSSKQPPLNRLNTLGQKQYLAGEVGDF